MGNRPTDWHVLDLEEDPVPGDPERVKSLARRLHDFADDVGDALRQIKGMAGDDALLKWAGKSADAFTAEFEDVPKNLRKLKKSYDLAGDALAAYWPDLDKAQDDSRRALEKGREARRNLSSANTRLDTANGWVDRASKKAKEYEDSGKKKDVPPPDEKDVRAATRNATNAKDEQRDAQTAVDNAQNALDAAKKMAADAKKLREDAATKAKKKLEEASDAGIENRSWWEEGIDWVSDNWDTIVAVCKVVVAVLGIVAMIIGGPILGAIVLIAALVVLADTLNKYLNGQATLWDVAFAALDCIPGMKGLTTLGGLAKGLKGGLSMAKTGLKGMALGAKGLGKGARSMGRQMKKLFTCGDPIDMATGQMVMSATDVELPGQLPLVLERHHRTGVHNGRFFGRSWTSTLDQRLLLDASGIRFASSDGMILEYPVPGPDTPVLPVEGPQWPLSWDGTHGGDITVHTPETGRTLTFRPLADRPSSELPLAVVSDRNHNTVTISYHPDGTPDEVAHHGGYRVGMACENGRITELTLRSHPEQPTLLRYGYDECGNLDRICDSSGESQKLFYDARRRVSGWEDRNGTWYRYAYDDHDRCTATHGVDNILDYTFEYDDTALTTTAVNSLGHATRYRFNDAYQLLAETGPLGHVVLQEWSRRDDLLSHTDQLGHSTHMEWDEAGNLTAVLMPDGSRTSARFNELNLPIEETDQNGAVWRQDWDERGNCVSVTAPDGGTSLFTHDGTGAVTSVVDPLRTTRHLTNNAAGLPISETDPLGAETRYAYDSFGRITAVSDPLGATTHLNWTVEGHLAERTSPDGTTEAWTYDGEGNSLTYTDALGHVTRFTYSHFGVPASRTGPDGVSYGFTHDSELRLIQVANPKGLTWDYVFDAAGNLVSETDFDDRTLRYIHDATGRLIRRVNPLGQSLTFTYDSVGSPIGKAVDGRETTYTNDPAGRLLRAVGPDALLTYQYDRVGRITEQVVDGKVLTTTYDSVGRPTLRTTPAGVSTGFTYDAAGNRTLLRASGRAIASTYDPQGRETIRRIGPHGLTLAHQWDRGDRLVAQTLTGPGGSGPLERRSFEYRADGNLTSLEDGASGRRSFDLDLPGRVTGVRADDWSESYAYDAAGNQTSAQWPDRQPLAEGRGDRTYAGNRVTRAGSVHYEYDAAGRVVLRRRTRLSRKPDIWRFTWDAEDRLTAVITPDGTCWRYLYDPLGRRIAKQRLGADRETVLEETRFTWDGPHLVEQTTSAAGSTEEVTLTWERDGTRPLAQQERRSAAGAPQDVIDERFFAIVTDLVGTPTELVSEAGDIAWRADATLWGLTTWSASAETSTPLRFPGQYFDPESQLHYNYHRHYDPATAHYISPDPLGMEAGPNPCTYVLNPLAWIDYLGLLTCRQNARRLRRNLRREGRGPARGQAAAHLVPSGGTRGHWAPGANARALLERYRVNVNDAANGIPLGHPSPHNFTHRQDFLQRLDDHLQDLVASRSADGYGARAIRTELRRELRSIGRQVADELSTGAPGPGAYWTA
ncbi:DUF6531 domain-containing protein [Streptomyces sp. NPDC047108]|uniref:DUF6531 domain-containing protein n=1 Tax=Streptomyces sp. NPDC047108 TaxID=3155025 RepID=UPI0033D0C76B